MNDLIQPRNIINEMMRQTIQAGQEDREILKALYRYMCAAMTCTSEVKFNRALERFVRVMKARV